MIKLSGIQYTAKDNQDNEVEFSEAPLVADLLEHAHINAQVMYSEAIPSLELKTFLNENSTEL